MKIINNYLKYFFFVLFFSSYSIAFSNNIQFNGLSKLTIDDLQSLTSVDIYSNNITDIDLDKIIKDLYSSDLIYDLDFSLDSGSILVSIVENSLIEEIYINGNIRIKDKEIKQICFDKFMRENDDINEQLDNVSTLKDMDAMIKRIFM